MTAAQIRDAARLVGADATAENCLSRTGEVAEIWAAGFIAGLEAALNEQSPMRELYPTVPWAAVRLLAAAQEAAETVGRP